MRIRQVKPEFWSDPSIGRLRLDERLTYIGLWQIADDDGWFVWEIPHVAARLYPFDAVRAREALVERTGARLIADGHLAVHPDCRCVQVVRLAVHQRVGTRPSYRGRDAHRAHSAIANGSRRSSATVEGRGNMEQGSSRAASRPRATPTRVLAGDDARAIRDSFRRLGLPVDPEPAP